jgi:hypothetical protein
MKDRLGLRLREDGSGGLSFLNLNRNLNLVPRTFRSKRCDPRMELSRSSARPQSQRDCVLQPRVARSRAGAERRRAERATLGKRSIESTIPKGLRPVPGFSAKAIDTSCERAATPLGLKYIFAKLTQGSSCLPSSLRYDAARATLGFVTESLWDSRNPATETLSLFGFD